MRAVALLPTEAGDVTVTDYPTTWWERTGNTTPWVDHPGGGRSCSQIFRCIATGEECPSTELPIGALFAAERDADDEPNGFPPVGHDGLSIVCVCIGNSGPGSRHHWYIDYRASNCTMKDDKEHRCWVRHGTVGEKVTVDKNGKTCGAGAGSFYMDNQRWHGFLRNGALVQG
jgi:hypothetical protein